MKPEILPKSKGIKHIFEALGYSWDGIKVAFKEAAFKMECICNIIVFVVACLFAFLGWFSITQAAILIAAGFLVMVVELLNTAIEAVVDLVSPGYNELAKHAKDMGSAAVGIVTLINLVLWGGFLLNTLLNYLHCSKCGG